jgi:hypothetical protein
MSPAQTIAIAARGRAAARFHRVWPAVVIGVGLVVTVLWSLMLGYGAVILVFMLV